MPENLLKNVDKDEAYISLRRNAGWLYLKKHLEAKKRQIRESFKTVDPENSIKIAKEQAKLNLINDIINKPDDYAKRRKKNKS